MFEFIFDFIAQMGTLNLVIILGIFVVFIFLMKKVIKTLINILWIAIASALFPLVLRFLGFSVPMDINTIIFFVILGLGFYGVYILGKVIYAALGIVEKGAKIVTFPITQHSKHKKEKMGKKMEEFLEEREELEKMREEKKKKK